MSKTYKVSAMGDVMYFKASDQSDASAQLAALCGDIPTALLQWQEVAELPDGEEYAADVR